MLSAINIEASKKLPASIHFGTSSWNYPGWRGLVYYRNYKNEREFKSHSLQEYAALPCFRTVGIDSSFYRPLSAATLEHYVSLLPADFVWVSKVWEEITIDCFPAHRRYGAKAGTANPNFLNAAVFCDRVLPPFSTKEVRQHNGPFIFQFQSLAERSPASFASFIEQLDRFLAALPRDFQYAVEVRNRELLCPDYFGVLNQHGATHCFNHWSYMPPLVEQMKCAAAAGGLGSSFILARLLTPLGVSYEAAVQRFQPYDRLQAINPQMRKDALRLAKRALERKVNAFILVNNRSEGCAPLTIDAIASALVEELSQDNTN